MMAKNQLQQMTRDYFNHLDRLNKGDLNHYVVGLVHTDLYNQCQWFLTRPYNQFHFDHAVTYHNYLQCDCWYKLSLQIIELLLIGRHKQPKALNQPITLPHCSDVSTPVEIAEVLGLFKFLG